MVPDELVDEAWISRELENNSYLLMALLLETAIKVFPKSVQLRLHNSFIQSSKLRNEFKAIFEVMKCNVFCAPNLQERFFMFREHIAIERKVMDRNNANLTEGEKVNPLETY